MIRAVDKISRRRQFGPAENQGARLSKKRARLDDKSPSESNAQLGQGEPATEIWRGLRRASVAARQEHQAERVRDLAREEEVSQAGRVKYERGRSGEALRGPWRAIWARRLGGIRGLRNLPGKQN